MHIPVSPAPKPGRTEVTPARIQAAIRENRALLGKTLILLTVITGLAVTVWTVLMYRNFAVLTGAATSTAPTPPPTFFPMSPLDENCSALTNATTYMTSTFRTIRHHAAIADAPLNYTTTTSGNDLISPAGKKNAIGIAFTLFAAHQLNTLRMVASTSAFLPLLPACKLAIACSIAVWAYQTLSEGSGTTP